MSLEREIEELKLKIADISAEISAMEEELLPGEELHPFLSNIKNILNREDITSLKIKSFKRSK